MKTVNGIALSAAADATLTATIKKDSTLRRLDAQIRTGRGDWSLAQAYAVRLGELLGLAAKKAVEAQGIEQIDEELAAEFLAPLLARCAELVADVCVAVVTTVNLKAGVKMKALRPAPSEKRAAGLTDKLGSYEATEDALWMLGEPLINYLQHVVDEAVRVNAEAQAMSGLAPVVRRISDSRDCPFCISHAGEYAPPLRYDIFRRHERCRCLILLEPHVGRRKQTAADAKKARDVRIARVLEAEGQLRR